MVYGKFNPTFNNTDELWFIIPPNYQERTSTYLLSQIWAHQGNRVRDEFIRIHHEAINNTSTYSESIPIQFNLTTVFFYTHNGKWCVGSNASSPNSIAQLAVKEMIFKDLDATESMVTYEI